MHKTSAVIVNAPETKFSVHDEVNNQHNNRSLYNFSGNVKAHRANALIQHFYQRLQGYQTFAPFFNHYSNRLYSRRKNTNNNKENSTNGKTFSTRFNSRATISLQPEPWEMIDDLLDTTTARLLRHQADSSIFAMLTYASTNNVSTDIINNNNSENNNSKSLLLPKINSERNNSKSDEKTSIMSLKETRGDVKNSSIDVNSTSSSSFRNNLIGQLHQQQENQLNESINYTTNNNNNNNNSRIMSKEMLLVQTWKADHPEATAAEVRRETNFWHKNAAQQRWNKNQMALQELRRETEILEKELNSTVEQSRTHNLQTKNNNNDGGGLTAQQRQQKQRLPKTPFSNKTTLNTSTNRQEHLMEPINYTNNNDDDDDDDEDDGENDDGKGSYNSKDLQTQLNKLRCLQEQAWNTFVKGEMSNDYFYEQEQEEDFNNYRQNVNEKVVWGPNENIINNNNNSELISYHEGASLHQWLHVHGWRHHSHRQENAATVIQCAYRCYLARGKVNQARLHRLHCLRELMYTEEEVREEWENAIQITIQLQGNTRYKNNNLSDYYYNSIINNDNTIQVIEGNKLNTCVNLLEEKGNHAYCQNASKEEMEKYQRAIHLLRNKVHAMLYKRRARALHEAQVQNEIRSYAAITIQRLYRGYQGRLEVRMIRNPALRQQRWERRITQSAIKLQTWWRCQYAQHRYVELQNALRTIQCAIKCWLARRVLYKRRAMKLRAEQAAIREYAWQRIAHFYYRYCRGRGTHHVCDKHIKSLPVERH